MRPAWLSVLGPLRIYFHSGRGWWTCKGVQFYYQVRSVRSQQIPSSSIDYHEGEGRGERDNKIGERRLGVLIMAEKRQDSAS